MGINRCLFGSKVFMLKCRDSKCASRFHCCRYTTSTKLGVKTFGREKGDDKCSGFVELFPEIKPKKKIVDTLDIIL